MSNFKKVAVTGGPPRQDVLAPLRMTQIVGSKPVLPAGKLVLPIRLRRQLTTARDLVYDSRLCHCFRPHSFRSGLQTHEGNGIRRLTLGSKITSRGMLE